MRRVMVAGAMVAGLSACGDDGGANPAGGEGDSAAFCDAFVAVDQGIEALPWGDPDALAEAFAEDVAPDMDRAEAAAPDVIAAHVAALTGAVRTVVSTGDFSAFEDPAVAAAQGPVFAHLASECGLASLEVTATDFTFDGMPATLAAGRAVLLLRNEGRELHEIGFARVNDGVELSAGDILALPEDEAFSMIEFRSGTSTPPGSVGGTTIDLDPGRYVYFCFIPVGSVDGEQGAGPPHAFEGMFGELIVE